ncbi:MAG: UDP-4-amino-4,6-dideoxy-N-acetyl-beta-L-altrosamine transaminase [Phycisphaerae bacterium]
MKSSTDCRSDMLAINGGKPVRTSMLPYGRQWIDEDDIAAVVEVLRGDWLTTGPAVERFEATLTERTGAKYAVSVSSGTAALHAMMHALGVGEGDCVLVPTMTFAATANAVRFCGGTPIFVDVDADSLLIDPADVEAKLTRAIDAGKIVKAIVAVDFAGQPCDYDALGAMAERHNVALLADGCHALGATYDSRPVGSIAKMTAFSFHPVKHVTAGEGGAVTTNDESLATAVRQFRNHCMNRDHHHRKSQATWEYDIEQLGFNYRLTDLQAALAASQMSKLGSWLDRRSEIARAYDAAFESISGIDPLRNFANRTHAYHLYVIRIEAAATGIDRERAFEALRAEGIGVNVHYRPVHQLALYANDAAGGNANCPRAESVYAQMLSLPIFPKMTDDDVADVIAACQKVFVRQSTSGAT